MNGDVQEDSMDRETTKKKIKKSEEGYEKYKKTKQIETMKKRDERGYTFDEIQVEPISPSHIEPRDDGKQAWLVLHEWIGERHLMQNLIADLLYMFQLQKKKRERENEQKERKRGRE